MYCSVGLSKIGMSVGKLGLCKRAGRCSWSVLWSLFDACYCLALIFDELIASAIGVCVVAGCVPSEVAVVCGSLASVSLWCELLGRVGLSLKLVRCCGLSDDVGSGFPLLCVTSSLVGLSVVSVGRSECNGFESG